MSWKDQYRDASFRGVAFHVQTEDGSFGRRTVTHEYPKKDKPYIEDLGRRVRSFSIEAIIIGPDYFGPRDALINACEEKGAGTLVHPYYGEMQVTLTEPCRVSQSSEQGGMCRVSLSFTEAGDYTYPAQTADTERRVGDQAAVTNAAGAAGFDKTFTVDNMPAFVRDGAATSLTDALTRISSAGRFSFSDAIGQSDFNALITGALSGVQSLLNVPANLSQSIFGAVSSLRQLAPNARDAFSALVSLFNFGSNHRPIVGTTPVRLVQIGNEAALVEIVQTAAVSNAAIALTNVMFSNATEATAIRDQVVVALESIAVNTRNDALFSAVQDLRAIVVRDVQIRSNNLARQVNYVPPRTMPACVLAYQLYADVNREPEILALNRIVHPGFVPGLLPIKVLANV